MFEDRTRDNITEKANVRLTYFRETGVAILSEVKIYLFEGSVFRKCLDLNFFKTIGRRYVVLL